jgi:hypothetical protein
MKISNRHVRGAATGIPSGVWSPVALIKMPSATSVEAAAAVHYRLARQLLHASHAHKQVLLLRHSWTPASCSMTLLRRTSKMLRSTFYSCYVVWVRARVRRCCHCTCGRVRGLSRHRDQASKWKRDRGRWRRDLRQVDDVKEAGHDEKCFWSPCSLELFILKIQKMIFSSFTVKKSFNFFLQKIYTCR